ncbi:MAG: hypothetical protein ABF289_02190 [Clostridiales bacterium]
MIIKFNFLLLSTIILFSILLTIALFLVALKAIDNHNKKKHQQYNLKFDDYISYLKLQLDKTDELMKPCFKLDSYGAKILLNRIVKLMTEVEDSNREKLVFLCERLGFIKSDLLRLRSSFNAIRLKAINRIRVMEVSRALPRLIYLLDLHKKDIEKNAIALAIIKCSDTNEYIIKMLYKLVKSGFNIIPLIEPIKESTKINRWNLILEILTEENDSLTKFGLLLVNTEKDRRLTPYLYKLSHSENRDIRIKAIRLLADMNADVLYKHIDEYINSNEWELRSVGASMVGELKLEKYIPTLKSNVNDSNMLVRYNSLKSLSKINMDGFKEVCRVASNIKNITLQKMIFSILEEEVEKNKFKSTMKKILSSTMVNSLFVKN